MCSQKIKIWLNLPRSFTASALHHPSLTYLASVTTSKDPVIQELLLIATDDYFVNSQKISVAMELLGKAKSSLDSITSKTLKVQCKSFFKEWSSETHKKKLEELSVQSKALEAIELENANNTWKRVQQGLPSGQLSFLLRASTDTLPTPLNLEKLAPESGFLLLSMWE